MRRRRSDEATEQAEAAADQLTYVWHRQLYSQGVLAPDLPDGALAGDELVGWEEFGELDASAAPARPQPPRGDDRGRRA